MKFIVLDSETTGLSDCDELIEIALILAEYDATSDKLTKIDEYSGLRYPECSVSRNATEIHGLTKRKLKGHNLDQQIITDFFDNAEFIVCHNAQFDIRFVVRVFIPSSQKKWYCTMHGIPWRNLGFSTRKLHDLLSSHSINIENSHRALSDANGLFNLLQKTNIQTGKSYFLCLLKSEPYTIDLNITYETPLAKERYEQIYGEGNVLEPPVFSLPNHVDSILNKQYHAKKSYTGCFGSIVISIVGFLLLNYLIF